MVCSKGYTREFCDWGANRSKVVISGNLMVFKFGDFVLGHKILAKFKFGGADDPMSSSAHIMCICFCYHLLVSTS